MGQVEEARLRVHVLAPGPGQEVSDRRGPEPGEADSAPPVVKAVLLHPVAEDPPDLLEEGRGNRLDHGLPVVEVAAGEVHGQTSRTFFLTVSSPPVTSASIME